jgi:hypothetical protein
MQKLTAMYFIEIENEKKKVSEEGLLLHFKQILIGVSLETNLEPYKIEKTLTKRNCV